MKLYISDLSIYVLVIFYLPLILWILWRILKRSSSIVRKIGMASLVIIVTYVIPLGDVTVNSLAMAKTCPTAGLYIYKTVQVEGFVGSVALRDTLYRFNEAPTRRIDGTYYWRRFEKQADGSITVTDLEKPTAEYEVLTAGGYAESVGMRLDGYDQVTHTKKSRWVIRNRVTGEVIAEWLFFNALPGWVDRFFVYRWFGTGGSALSCTWGSDFSGWREKILIPKHS